MTVSSILTASIAALGLGVGVKLVIVQPELRGVSVRYTSPSEVEAADDPACSTLDPHLGMSSFAGQGWMADIQLAVEIVSDIVVTGSIAYRLWRSRTGWKGTDRIITRLIRYDSSPLSSLGERVKLTNRLILETQTPPTVV
jgi:hypothetical protein